MKCERGGGVDVSMYRGSAPQTTTSMNIIEDNQYGQPRGKGGPTHDTSSDCRATTS